MYSTITRIYVGLTYQRFFVLPFRYFFSPSCGDKNGNRRFLQTLDSDSKNFLFTQLHCVLSRFEVIRLSEFDCQLMKPKVNTQFVKHYPYRLRKNTPTRHSLVFHAQVNEKKKPRKKNYTKRNLHKYADSFNEVTIPRFFHEIRSFPCEQCTKRISVHGNKKI